jgi:hypothetical protein
MGRKGGLFRHGQPTAHLVGSMKKSCSIFAENSANYADLSSNKSFTFNKSAQRYLDTAEVRSSSLLVPTIFINGLATEVFQTRSTRSIRSGAPN